MALISQELGVSKSSVEHWLKAYQLGGEAGLQNKMTGRRKNRLPAPITDKIVELKKENPTFGIKRISQVLRRCFFLPASPETEDIFYLDCESQTISFFARTSIRGDNLNISTIVDVN
jgi:hypothetical protein